MPSVRIPTKELTQFDLPAVCVVTGTREGVSFRKVQFSWVPPTARMLIVFCGLIGVVAMLAMQKRVHGELPFSDAGWERWRSGKILVGVGAAAAVALVLLGVAMISSASGSFGLVIVLGGIGVLVAAALAARGRGPMCKRIGDDDIELDLPSADAAAAFEERLRVDDASEDDAPHPARLSAPGASHDDVVYDRKVDQALRELD